MGKAPLTRNGGAPSRSAATCLTSPVLGLGSVPGEGLLVLVAGSGIGQVVCLLGEVRELHVGFDVLATLLDGVLRRLALLVSYRETFLDSVPDRGGELFRQRLHVAVLQSLVGGCNRRLDAARRLQSGEALALALSERSGLRRAGRSRSVRP